jgi:beta-lactamase regulating signal transducer with metallopeptidase domain
MIAWMMYAALVGGLLAGAAAAVDRLARLAGRPTRWIWVGAMLASIALAALEPHRTVGTHAVTISVPGLTPVSQTMVVANPWWVSLRLWFADVRGLLDAPLATVAAALARLPVSAIGLTIGAWVLVSATLAAVLLLVHMRFARAARQWPVAELHGTRVRLSSSTGPVVIGLIRPEIIVPRWLLDRSPAEQRVVLDHESEHISARDAFVLAGACVVVALMPWNAALWYILRRLRLAVELDCDARVLRRGVSVSTYGTLLIDLAEQALPLRLTAAALADDTSHLHQRIVAMKPQVPRFVWLRAGAAVALAFVGLLAACEAKMPTESDIQRMDVASAERAARQLSLIGAKDSVIYTIDGLRVSEQTAKGVSPGLIQAINFEKLGAGASIMAIATKDPNPERYGGPRRLCNSSDCTSPTGVSLLTVRGKQSGPAPLLIIDGVRTDQMTFAKLKGENIESVEVIKGRAATEYYGPDAQYGVIVVKTKGK